MKSLILLSLFSLPSTLALAVQGTSFIPPPVVFRTLTSHAARQQNATTTSSPTSPSILPILPKPNSYTQALVAENCARWDKIGELGFNNCESALELYRDVTYSDLILWNPSVGPSCDTMWHGYWVCLRYPSPTIPPLTPPSFAPPYLVPPSRSHLPAPLQVSPSAPR